jgi:hypothetical protein
MAYILFIRVVIEVNFSETLTPTGEYDGTDPWCGL